VAIISIFSGSFCHGGQVAALVAQEMGYARIDDQLVSLAALRYGVPQEKLARAMYGPPPFFNRLTREREKSLAYLRAALAELVQGDNVVYHGFASQLLPRSLTHALRVCLIANLEHRLGVAMREEGLSRKEAARIVRRDDAERVRWTRFLGHEDPYEERLYDLLLPMQELSSEDGAAAICQNARKEAVRTTPKAQQAAVDFLLAAQVNVVLAEAGHEVEVRAHAGQVIIAINRYVTRLEPYQRKLEALARKVPGVAGVRSEPGQRFIPPALVGPTDLDLPTKVLLVDDEREFVHTLSERLQTRNLPAEIVYDGEQALACVENEPPEVMVLDLKMPGIDGIEVLRQVKQTHPEVEVIILTGHGSEREEQLARELGAFAYLRKPVDVDVLTRTMQAAYRKLGTSPPRTGPEGAERAE
jgi:two-component system response regulator CpxR